MANLISDLKAISVPPTNKTVLVLGGATLDDGQGGTYHWISDSTATGDDAEWVTPASNPLTGRWRRISKNVEDYAASGHTHAGVYQPSDQTLTGLAGLDGSAGVVYQIGEDLFTKRAVGTTTNTIAAGDHTHATLVPTSRTITTQHSLTGGGDLSANRTLNLVGDTASPGNSKFYGTNSSGTRGWYDAPTGGTVTSLNDVGDVTYTGTPSDSQALVWSSGAWRNATIAAATGSGTAVDTIAEMTAISAPTANHLVTVQGYYAAGDGGGGMFRWDVISTANTDGGTIFAGPDGAGVSGRWIRYKGGNGDIRWFGARQNEPASDAISNGLKAMYAGAFGVLVIPPGVWPINGVINENVRDNTGVIAEGATFVPYNGVMGQISVIGLKSETLKIVESGANRGSMILVLSSMTGVEVGDLIHIASDRDFIRDGNTAPAHEKLQEFQSIRYIDVDNRKVWLDAPMLFTITPYAVEATVNGRIYKVTRDFFWRGGTFDCQNLSETTIAFTGFRNLHIQNVNFINSLRNSLRIICSAYDKTVNCHFVDHGDMQTPDQVYENINGLNFGYGIIHTNSCYSSVMNCTAGRGWHAFEAAGGTRDIRYVSCLANSNAYGFNQHAGVGRVTLDNCTSEGTYGIQAHAAEVVINGGLFRGRAIASGGWRSYKLRCVGTDFEAESSNSTLTYIAGARISGINSTLEFIGCRFKDGNTLVWADYDHVIVKDCLQINNVLEVIFKKAYIKDCTSISHRDVDDVLRLQGHDGSAKEVWIDNYFSTTTQPINNVIRAANATVFVKNSTFDVVRHAGSGHLFFNVATHPTSYWYVTNCTFRTAGNLGANDMHIKLLKDCIILQGTGFTPGTGATIEHQEGNLFMEAL